METKNIKSQAYTFIGIAAALYVASQYLVGQPKYLFFVLGGCFALCGIIHFVFLWFKFNWLRRTVNFLGEIPIRHLSIFFILYNAGMTTFKINPNIGGLITGLFLITIAYIVLYTGSMIIAKNHVLPSIFRWLGNEHVISVDSQERHR